jgi:hypothetical protein
VLAAGSTEYHRDSVTGTIDSMMLGWLSLTILDLIRAERIVPPRLQIGL